MGAVYFEGINFREIDFSKHFAVKFSRMVEPHPLFCTRAPGWMLACGTTPVHVCPTCAMFEFSNTRTCVRQVSNSVSKSDMSSTLAVEAMVRGSHVYLQ